MDQHQDYKKIFSEIIKKQMLVLGPDITLAKVKSVQGIEVDANGEVTKIEGEPQVLLQNLINQFVELSGLIVKKTMESILSTYPDGISSVLKTETSQRVNPSQAQASIPPSPSPNPQAPIQNEVVNQPPPNPPHPQQASSEQPPQNSDIDELNKMVNDINKSAEQYEEKKKS